ncbi:MAG: hypothetical protein ABIO70_21775, partial [Pseudomonadota bacterium]
MRPRPLLPPPLLPLLAAVLLGGCAARRPLAGASEPAWEAPVAAPDPTLDTWLADHDRPAGSTTGTALDADTLRRLVVARHPDVRAAEAELVRAQAHARHAGAWENPELGGRLLLQGPEAPTFEASLTETLPISGRIAAERHAAAAGRARA